MTDTLATGGCQCGAVRYRITAPFENPHICHCRMCQKAFGNYFAALVGTKKTGLDWTRGQPAFFRSSEIVQRGFCRDCGTPLTFEFPDAENMDLTIGSFDEPDYFRPHLHFSIETRLEVWVDTGDLPGYRLADHAPVADRWKKALGKLPD